jgi:NAD dependent epimerase/dehydratase family enzyme
VNLTAPNPATNAELTKALAAALHRPALFAVPAPALRLALGEMSTEILSSCRAVPARLGQAGFEFRYPELGPALAAAIGGRAGR